MATPCRFTCKVRVSHGWLVPMTSAVIVQMTIVSMNGSSKDTDTFRDRLVGPDRGVGDRGGTDTGFVREDSALEADDQGTQAHRRQHLHR